MNIWENYKVVQIWPGLIVCKQVTVCPGHIWTTLYVTELYDRAKRPENLEVEIKTKWMKTRKACMFGQ
jgi:hypothetical protein